jgi:ABC-2 type transport system permease protein
MTTRLNAEWRKLTTTRTFSGLLAGAGLVAAVGAFSTTSASTAPPWHMDVSLHEQTLWVLAAINGGIFAIILGSRTFTDEFRHHTIAHTYIADPKRTRSTLAKAGAAAASGILVGAVTVAALVLLSLIMAASSDGEVAFHRSDLVPTAGLIVAMALWAMVGAGLGAIIRNQVAVVATGLSWILMLENLGAGLLEGAGRYLPGQAVHAMTQTGEAVDLLASGAAGILMAGYAALLSPAQWRSPNDATSPDPQPPAAGRRPRCPRHGADGATCAAFRQASGCRVTMAPSQHRRSGGGLPRRHRDRALSSVPWVRGSWS